MRKTFLILPSAFFLLSASAFAELANTPKQVVYEVPKMMCGGCTGRVSKAIQFSSDSSGRTQPRKGVSDVHVTLDDHTARFTCDVKAGCDEGLIKKDLIRIQYPPKEVKE